MRSTPKYVDSIDADINETIVNLAGKKRRIGDLTSIDQTDISNEFSTQASRYAYVGLQAAMAESAYEKSKADRQLLYAKLDREIRNDPEYAGRKPTEANIAQMITEEEEYQDALDLELDRYQNFRVMRAIADAMRQRGDMLISLGATLRAESDQVDMSIRQMRDRVKSKMP